MSIDKSYTRKSKTILNPIPIENPFNNLANNHVNRKLGLNNSVGEVNIKTNKRNIDYYNYNYYDSEN